MTITHLVTHSGGFHADELLSSVILTRLFPEATLVRTRDTAMITPGSGKVIYDVGRAYDAEQMIFDHHQRPVPLRPLHADAEEGEEAHPYSSFGLIWHHFGRDYLRALEVPELYLDEVWGSFDRGFVLPIDLMDNGAMNASQAGPMLASLTLPALIDLLKPVFDETADDADDQAFLAALPIAKAFVEGSIKKKCAKRRADTLVRDAITAAGDSAVLELPQGMPFRSAVEATGADHLLYVIHPRGGDWALNCIRKGGDTFENRADLPEAWAGLTDAALEDASGVKGAKFCHNGRFIAVASSREAIVALAELAVADAKAR
ncbi:hypothetical protein TRM7557_01208 [Tritonibacter multivorans]|uniref:Metal-dependent hydrolase n=1 Tax=Tritonibacter multivorans TaxID=928856 RepID=A0A0P1GP94_9RHOB|nr:MYG1 family protein [Tritonibacter multivorans]MDA7422622.1 MYG1 family protein [Tritonibacter multivorans]CUH77103.1 hypothetical protein TRM7557_01208 [Tritonibacter multivorans]SFD50609.1 Uncharacterized protein, UPF0160 family [Tritonibacter multivorans]